MAARRTATALATLATAAFALLAGAAVTSAAPEPRDAPARDAAPWATVNVCDTVGHPDGVGVRGSMPGTGDPGEAMFMRLRLQYYRRADGVWRGLRGADTGFLALGRADVAARQAGRTFTITPPGRGQPAFLLRGVVSFQWRRDGVVVARARRVTAGGHPGTAGADPAGFSTGTCAVR
jgi:hypothetical protein